jgi:hypothetical protein
LDLRFVAARVERRDRLQEEDDEAEHEPRDVEHDQRNRVLLPVLRARLAANCDFLRPGD